MDPTKKRLPRPAVGLASRECPTCGVNYQPYRSTQRACSRACRDRLPDKLAAYKAYQSSQDVRDRKNAARRGPKQAAENRRQRLRKYGLTLEQHDEMLDRQGGRCTICGSLPDPNGVRSASRLHVDHDHVTGAVRELLCNRCNMGVGYFRDDPDLLRAAAEYIERHRSNAA